MPYAARQHKPKTAGRTHQPNKAHATFSSSRRWRKLRGLFIRSNPVCIECGHPAEHVDHIKPRATHPELAFDWENLQSLCASCHSKKTNAEQRAALQGEGASDLPKSRDC